jgi:hypothetical protein
VRWRSSPAAGGLPGCLEVFRSAPGQCSAPSTFSICPLPRIDSPPRSSPSVDLLSLPAPALASVPVSPLCPRSRHGSPPWLTSTPPAAAACSRSPRSPPIPSPLVSSGSTAGAGGHWRPRCGLEVSPLSAAQMPRSPRIQHLSASAVEFCPSICPLPRFDFLSAVLTLGYFSVSASGVPGPAPVRRDPPRSRQRLPFPATSTPPRPSPARGRRRSGFPWCRGAAGGRRRIPALPIILALADFNSAHGRLRRARANAGAA